MYDLQIIHSADKLVREVIGVPKTDTVLVITDAAKLTVGKAFTLVCRAHGKYGLVSF